jgi:hypothetical protein
MFTPKEITAGAIYQAFTKRRTMVTLSQRLIILAIVLGLSVAVFAIPDKEPDGKKIDAGSFGVFQKGHRVGTETFAIYQTSYGSLIRSEFKTENAPTTDVQTSEMQLTSKGDLRRYEWKEVSPGSAQSVVAPNSDFLEQKSTTAAGEKEHVQPYLLPASTIILDDYFFVHRELLAWHFLGMVCKQDKGQLQCQPKQKMQFGTLNPHQQSSAQIGAEFIGRELVSFKNGPQDLLKIELKNDAGAWVLWLDEQFRVMKMSVVGENTDVVRD